MMTGASSPVVLSEAHSGLRWRIALLVSGAIAISYLDRQTLPWAVTAIQADIPISYQTKAFLDSAFLITYGLMYIGGGWLVDRLGTRRMTLGNSVDNSSGDLILTSASNVTLGGTGSISAAGNDISYIINAGTAFGSVIAPPLIAVVLTEAHWLHLAPWRWLFFLTGTLGLVWTLGWWREYQTPQQHQTLIGAAQLNIPRTASPGATGDRQTEISLSDIVRHRETWAVVLAKFLSDAAWYFYLFWLPKYLFDAFQLDIKTAGSIGWIPYAASGVGCLAGGGLSSWLLARGLSVNRARKLALGASAALMPWVMFVPHLHLLGWVIFIFSLAFFGQQSWSTLLMILPTDMISRRFLGTLAGFVGFGGAMGGVVLGQAVGWLRDHGYSYTPALVIAGSLHVAAFILICALIPTIQPLTLCPRNPTVPQ